MLLHPLSQEYIKDTTKKIKPSIDIDPEIYDTIYIILSRFLYELFDASNLIEITANINKLFENDRPNIIPKLVNKLTKAHLSQLSLDDCLKVIGMYLVKLILKNAIQITIGNTLLGKVPELSPDDIYMSLFQWFDKNVFKYIRDNTKTEIPPRSLIFARKNSPNPIKIDSPIREFLGNSYPSVTFHEDGFYIIQNLIIELQYIDRNNNLEFLNSLPNKVYYSKEKNIDNKWIYQICGLIMEYINIHQDLTRDNKVSFRKMLESILYNQRFNFVKALE